MTYSASEEAEIQRLMAKLQPHAARTERAICAVCGERERRRFKLREIQRGILKSYQEGDPEAPTGPLITLLFLWLFERLLWEAITRLARLIWDRFHQ